MVLILSRKKQFDHSMILLYLCGHLFEQNIYLLVQLHPEDVIFYFNYQIEIG